MLFIFAADVAVVWNVTDYALPDYKHKPFPEHAQSFAIGLIVYTVLMIASRFYECGSYVFLESVWACNLGMGFCAIGVLCNKPLLVAAAFSGVSMDQLMWYVDLTVYFIRGKFPIGAAKYLIWPNTSWTKKVTCIHHLLFLPLCMYLLDFDLPPYSFFFGSLFTTVATGLCRALTPYEIADPADPTVIHYLNINCGYGFWRDVKIKALHWGDNLPPWLWVPTFAIWGNGLLNGPSYLLFLWMCEFIKSRREQ